MKLPHTLLIASILGFAVGGTAACGSSACDQLEDCCNALNQGASSVQCSNQGGGNDDLCQIALDVAAQSPNAPDECR